MHKRPADEPWPLVSDTGVENTTLIRRTVTVIALRTLKIGRKESVNTHHDDVCT